VVFFWQNSRASSVIPLSPDALASSSDAIVLGRVTSIQSAPQDDGNIYTFIAISVEREFFGHLNKGTTIYLKQLGGRFHHNASWVFGSPEFFVGEEVVVFSELMRDGFFRAAHLFQGKFTVDSANLKQETPAGTLVLGTPATQLRSIQEVDRAAARRRKETRPNDFVTQMKLRESEELQEFSYASLVSDGTASRRRKGDNFPPGRLFTLEAGGVRWHQFDSSIAVPFYVNTTNAPLSPSNTIAAIDSALQAWNSIPATHIVLSDGGQTALSGQNFGDGTNVITFGDPQGIIQDPVGCAGTLAVTYIQFGVMGNRIVNGVNFKPLFQADIVFANGMNCFLAVSNNLAQVTGHEVGHGIGFDHSSENPNELNPVLKDALMYYLAHNDGRGASPRADDIAAAQFVYPGVVITPTASNFFTLTPCRLVDTRNPNGPFGGPALSANSDRTFTLAGVCGVPGTAKSLSLNVTVTGATALGNLRFYPGGSSVPNTSTINYRAGQTRANSAIIPLGPGGTLSVHSDQGSGTVHLIIDVNGYFE
jgi:hypothetical protein